MTIGEKEQEGLSNLALELHNMSVALSLVANTIDTPLEDALHGFASHAKRISASIDNIADMVAT